MSRFGVSVPTEHLTSAESVRTTFRAKKRAGTIASRSFRTLDPGNPPGSLVRTKIAEDAWDVNPRGASGADLSGRIGRGRGHARGSREESGTGLAHGLRFEREMLAAVRATAHAARMDDTVRRIVERLGLERHPEGGWFREAYQAATRVQHPAVGAGDAARPAGTAIYFLLPADDFSALHRVTRSDELWHLYAGDPLELHLIHGDGAYEVRHLTSDLADGEPVAVVEAGCWQAARVVDGGAWSLCGCTVAPGFTYADFELADAGSLLERFPRHEAVIGRFTR
jgi:predicted cupin superfamily sugar epimerase